MNISYTLSPIPSLPYCEPTSPFLLFISQQLHSCIPTPLALISTFLGVCSITSWLFAQLPQIVTNYQAKSTDGLSFLFLLIWCLGDSSNLAGAVLLDQMTFQKVVASYYVIVDVVLVTQYIWYTIIRPRIHKHRYTRINDTATSSSGKESFSRFSIFLVFSRFFKATSASPLYPRTPSLDTNTVLSIPFSPLLLFLSPPSTPTLRFIGHIVSWTSTFFYLSSRLPQLLLNYRRRSVAGLSPGLFFAAFCGNFFYSLSILTNPQAWCSYGPYGGGGWVDGEGSDRHVWWGNTLPFLLGAAGVLGQDMCVGWQFLLWGQNESYIVDIAVDVDGSGVSSPVIVGVQPENTQNTGSSSIGKTDNQPTSQLPINNTQTRKKFTGIEIRRDRDDTFGGDGGQNNSENDNENAVLLGTTLNGGRIYGTWSPLGGSFRGK